MVLLRWLSSWFLISKETCKVHQKDTLDLAIHSSCVKALHGRGCLRLKQVLGTENLRPHHFPPWLSAPPQPSTCLKGMLSLANGPQTLKEFDMTNLRQTWPVHWLCQSKTNGQYHAFAAPSSPPRDWHGGPYPTHGELAQGLSLTMRPTRTASPLRFFSPQWPETRLSPGSCGRIDSFLVWIFSDVIWKPTIVYVNLKLCYRLIYTGNNLPSP